MAIAVAGKILNEIRYDTKQARSEMKKLSGEERKRHKQLVDGLEAQNAKIDRQINGLARAAVAVGAITAAYHALKVGFEAYAERQQMFAAGAGKALNELKKSSHGLISDTKLLSMEAAMLNGAQKMTNEQMDKAVGLMMALRKEGNDFNEVQTEVTRAFVELNTEGLKKFGVNIKAATGSTDAFNKLLEEADKHVDAFGGDLSINGDRTKKSMVDLKNATDDIKIALGELAETIIPMLSKPLNWLIDKVGMVFKGWEKLYNLIRHSGAPQGKDIESTIARMSIGAQKKYGRITGIGSRIWREESTTVGFGHRVMDFQKEGKRGSSVRRIIKRAADMMMVGNSPVDYVFRELGKLRDEGLLNRIEVTNLAHAINTPWTTEVQPLIAANKASYAAKKAAEKMAAKAKPKPKRKRKRKPRRMRRPAKKVDPVAAIIAGYDPRDPRLEFTEDGYPYIAGVGIRSADELIARGQDPIRRAFYGEDTPDVPVGLPGIPGVSAPGQFSYGQTALDVPMQRDPGFFLEDQETRMDKFLGKIGSLNEATIGVDLLSQSFHGLTDAFGSAIGAWLEGSDSFESALRKMTANFLKNLAIQESVEALKHGAYAIGSLAFLDFRGAALHAKAAAMHGAVAVAAGLGARELGIGAQAPSTVSPAAAGGGGGTRQQTIILGADFADDSARSRSHRLASILRQADRTGAGGTVVEYS